MSLLAACKFEGVVEGKRACLDYAVYAENLADGEGEVDVHLYYCDAEGAPLAPIGTFVLPLRDFDSGWLRRFWAQYQNDSDFRSAADGFYRIGSALHHHETVVVTVPGKGDQVVVAKPIAEAIWTLNAQGFHTKAACSGGAASRAYVIADRLPPELEAVADSAGFSVMCGEIRVAVSMTQPLAAEAASAALCRMLDDWSKGQLDAGAHYTGWQQALRASNLIPLPVTHRSPDRSPEVRELIKRSLQGKARFQDFAKLRSGRDQFSRASVDDLLGSLNLASVPRAISSLPDTDVRKALRWMCRGLPEGLAMRKVAVDAALTERAREKSKRAAESEAAIEDAAR